ncbi:MAG: nucleotide exchange factor GrpE [Treponema sp.]|nr:nucleotide exchange factor GrpE [Victivallales bacterium]MBP5751443.1 nucleotide exchange factor GrpE [Treponema sp.]
MNEEKKEQEVEEVKVDEAEANAENMEAETVENEENSMTGDEPADNSSSKEPEVPDYAKKAAELEDKYLRCRAEFDNYRKRMAREFNDVREQTRRMTITDFLTVHDYFAMGMASIETAPNIEILKQGMNMIWAEFQKVLDGLGVKEVNSVGKHFDAKIHDAVSQEPSDTVPEGVVIREYKKAFMLGDKLLRPAVVIVSSGPAKPVDVTPENNSEKKAEDQEEKREE